MNKNQKTFIDLISFSIKGQKATAEQLADIDWQEMILLAQRHSVLPLLFTALSLETVGKNLYASLKNYVYLQILDQDKRIKILQSVLAAFANENMPIIVLKGLALKNLYPIPSARIMGDFDLLVRQMDMDKGIQLLVGLGFKMVDYGHLVHVVMSLNDSIIIELHKHLFDSVKYNLPQDYLKNVWLDADASQYGSNVCQLSNDDTILYLILHLYKHYEEGGFGIRQLCDIALFMEKKQNGIDWDRLYSLSLKLGILRFTYLIFNICGNLFGIKIPDAFLKGTMISKEQLQLFIDEIVAGGVFGVANRYHKAKSKIMETMDYQDYQGVRKIIALRKLLFPDMRNLKDRYTYARQYPVLLPAAWLHRLLFVSFNTERRSQLIAYLAHKDTEITEEMKESKKLLYWIMEERHQKTRRAKNAG